MTSCVNFVNFKILRVRCLLQISANQRRKNSASSLLIGYILGHFPENFLKILIIDYPVTLCFTQLTWEVK